jgi:quercetin dioxygenase-like cupin family protein
MSHATPDGPFDPAELATRQASGIVSRVLLKEPGGSVTLFAFDAGQEVSEHSAPFDALVHVLDGEADVTIGGTTHRVGADRMIRLPANVPHALKAPQPFRMLLTMLRA